MSNDERKKLKYAKRCKKKMLPTLRKQGLIDHVSAETKIVKEDVKEILEIIFDKIRDEVSAGRRVEIASFGAFAHRVRPPKRAYHLGGYARVERKPKMIIIPATKVPVFKATKNFKIS